MSVRVVARVRPLLQNELDKDVIVNASTGADSSTVKIPNPRNESENYTFQFNNVYDKNATQQQIFEDEVAPTVKSLFKGLDVTIFAYGVTGTGKTHTMRGGKTLAERGVIPRLLSNIYRRSKKLEKDTDGETRVEVSMSYYEIYCDRVFDLFEAPEKRTPAGLPIRDNGGKTVVVGLTERPCTSLKEFEQLYDEANINRSTSATKLNAHSSRSHAILSVKVTQITGDQERSSTVSAIDLAGSEDNRRTENGKERMVESAAINKSLFVLAQCVEAISKRQSRIPYRESRMTRILSLGQNNGITIMILNLSPLRSYHLDTLSSLNFANRTKKIETNEIENQPIFRAVKQDSATASSTNGPAMQRQPLRPKNFTTNVVPKDSATKTDKAVKSFMVYSDKPKPVAPRPNIISGPGLAREAQKRTSSEAVPTLGRPSKVMRPNGPTTNFSRPSTSAMTQESIEALIERKVAEKLAESAMNAKVTPGSVEVSAEVQARLDALEQRVGSKETERSEGLQYLLMAKQHQVRGEDASALKMYQLALPFFPGNEKLSRKLVHLQEKIRRKTEEKRNSTNSGGVSLAIREQGYVEEPEVAEQEEDDDDHDGEYKEEFEQPESEDDEVIDVKRKPRRPRALPVFRDDSDDELAHELTLSARAQQTPRTKNLLRIINTRDVSQIRLLKGVGAKKAEAMVTCLCELDDGTEDGQGQMVRTLSELGQLKGVGSKGVEKMREGLAGFVF
ncbi:hypothetical protein MBLNU457_7400t1 [Dothideomycetes sp. NU457]